MVRSALAGGVITSNRTAVPELEGELGAGQTLPQELRPESISVLPLPAGGEVLGALTLVRTEPGPGGGEADEVLLRTFCGCVGAALANARELAEAREAVLAAENEAQARSRSLAAISHEIRTPLHSILGYGQLLLDGIPGPLPEASRRYVTSMAEGARHLAELMEDVLALHRLEAATQPLDRAEVAANEVLEECSVMLQGAARTAGLAFEVSAPAELRLVTDRGKLRQVLPT
jgi:signal transduction histidine kinase